MSKDQKPQTRHEAAVEGNGKLLTACNWRGRRIAPKPASGGKPKWSASDPWERVR